MPLSQSFEARVRSFPITELPETTEDAAILAFKISVRCLWADSLCIIQDSNEDKVHFCLASLLDPRNDSAKTD